MSHNPGILPSGGTGRYVASQPQVEGSPGYGAHPPPTGHASYGNDVAAANSGYYPAIGTGRYGGFVEGASDSWDSMSYPEGTRHTQSANVAPGSFYPTGELVPRIFGYPVNSLAYDSAYQAIFVASTTQSMSTSRWRSHGASLLVTHSTIDGMMYSGVAGHPEAPSSILQASYECMYGVPKTHPVPPSRMHIPSHAYRPPYGGCNIEQTMTLPGSGNNIKEGHIGITTMLPLGQGYVATISPSAVRIHSHGGLQLHDQDLQGMLSGTIHPYTEGSSLPTHITVGGIPCGETHQNQHEVHCIDLWQGLRIISSRKFRTNTSPLKIGVTAMATSQARGAVVAGCSDGNIRVLDHSLREMATVQSHLGGVASVAVSADGMTVATTGYGSRLSKNKETSSLFSFPDSTIKIYDIRYLGRGGITHPFSGVQGGPRFCEFLPDMKGLPPSRLLVASGQPGGGMQIIVPFETKPKSSAFAMPSLQQGEAVSAMTYSDGAMALGTSTGRILQFKLSGFGSNNSGTSNGTEAFSPEKLGAPGSPSKSKTLNTSEAAASSPKEKIPMPVPPYVPPVSNVVLDPTLLINSFDPGLRPGNNEKTKSLFGAYVLQKSPKLTPIGTTIEQASATFGSLGRRPIVSGGRRNVANSLIQEAAAESADYVLTIPTEKLGVSLLTNHASTSKRYRGKKAREPLPNPNKLLYASGLSMLCYEDGLDKRRRSKPSQTNGSSDDVIPTRYRLKLRPHFKASGAFNSAEYNTSRLFPGWDYSPTMPNAFAVPIALLLYFFPEIRSNVVSLEISDKALYGKGNDKTLSPELGFLFHQIDFLSAFGLLHVSKLGIRSASGSKPHIAAFVPTNFIASLMAMPEAEQLQILDNSPAAVDTPRRPEAFFRFLAYQIDKESIKSSSNKPFDSLLGIDFISTNEFVNSLGPENNASTKTMTLDLSYDTLPKGTTKVDKSIVYFGDILRHALCRETRLRAWNQGSKAYETIVQRKIAMSLPKVLTISCSCAGRKEEDGLWMWRQGEAESPWLPEVMEIELLCDGNVVVREQYSDDSEGKEAWRECTSSIPQAVAKLAGTARQAHKVKYRLDAVLSFVRTDFSAAVAEGDGISAGHHVLHTRISKAYRQEALVRQRTEAANLAMSDPENKNADDSSLIYANDSNREEFRQRAETCGKLIDGLDKEDTDDWMLFNGFVVSKTVVEDARIFKNKFKEPCLIVFRAIDDAAKEADQKKPQQTLVQHSLIPASIMNVRSLAHNTVGARPFDISSISKGSLMAFDAEFVSVQEEDSALTEDGSKIVLRDTRYALARISIIDCTTRKAIIDDYVLPREPVVDYLTRFSGIVAQDLDPIRTTHNLVSARSAYLKLRYLLEQGVIFLGHGLRQDFATVNLAVPPHQILDTVHIFHQPKQRYISLRFLANHVLGRDMQQDIHDSVEDAMAAFELYETALEWKKTGEFNKKLHELYALGNRTEWKLQGHSKT